MVFDTTQTLAQFIETGQAARTHAGEAQSGDLAFLKGGPWGLLAAAIDGLGHGPEAADAAQIACEALAQEPHRPIWRLFQRCHEALKGSRGVALTVAFFNHGNTLTWAGVGNVEGTLLRKQPLSGHTQENVRLWGGVVGYRMPPLRLSMLPLRKGDTVILTTDGVRGGFADSLNLDDSAQMIADHILNRHAKNTDDALVLVIRFLGEGE